MDSCALCKKEDPIMGVASKAYPIGAKCYAKLVEFDVPWDQDTTLDQVRAGLRARRRADRLERVQK